MTDSSNNGGSQAPGSQGRISKKVVEQIHDFVLSGGDVAPVRTTKGQFGKGTSGNPEGRPKRAELGQIVPPAELDPNSLGAIAARYGARTAKVRTADGEVEMTLKEAIVAVSVQGAAKGNTGHSRTALQFLGRVEVEEARRKREVFAYWSAQRELAIEIHAQAEQNGEEPPLFVHPLDIVLKADGSVEILGPTDPGDIAVMHYRLSRVDYHLAHIGFHQWVERRWIRRHGRRVKGILYAELDFFTEQRELPLRLQMSIEEVSERLTALSKMSGRALHALLREEGAKHDIFPPPRELRIPIIIPVEAIELAKEKGISARGLMSAWLEAMRIRIDQLLEKHQLARVGSAGV